MLSETISLVFGLLVGGLIGHRLAVQRDKRREFNAVAAPIVQNLLEIEEQARANHLWKELDLELIARIKPYLTERNRQKLGRLVEEHQYSVRAAHPVNSEHPYEGSEPDLAVYPSIVDSVVELRRFLKVR